MATKSTFSATQMPEQIVTDIFNKVKGHSSLAKLGTMMSVPFSGTDIFTFSLDGEVSIVGEGQAKPAGDATLKPVSVKPIKVVYQHRVSDEFLRATEERQLNILKEFSTGFSRKIARGLDIMAMHGVNPADLVASAQIGANHLDAAGITAITEADGKPVDAIEDAVTAIGEYDASGMAFAKSFGSELGKITENKVRVYPEFALGANPGHIGGIKCDVNSTVSKGKANAVAYVGDFESAFRWGYAANMPMEVIPYGDPDGQGDLKRNNEVVIRAEAFIGWGILDTAAFARIVKGS